MLDILIQKYKSWSLANADKFHNYTTRGNLDGEYMWEKDPDGFFIYRSAGSYFCSDEGIVYSLSCVANKTDWINHVNFYNQVKTTNCRIDIPVEYQELTINDINFYYRVFYRPNREYGRDYHLDIFDGKVDTQYFLKYIEDASEIISEFKKFNSTLPKLGITPFKRMFDSKGHFWIDFKYWNSTFSSMVNTSIKTLDIVLFYLEYNNIGKYDKELILGRANEIWNM